MARAVLIACVLLVPAAARAHDADLIAMASKEEGEAVTLTATLTAQTLALLAPLDADGDGLFTQPDAEASSAAIRQGFWEQAPLTSGGARCALDATSARVRTSDVVLEARYRCGPGELAQDDRFLSVLPKNYTVTLGAKKARWPSTTLRWRSAGSQAAPPLAPPPIWVWAIFLAGPIALMLFERRRF